MIPATGVFAPERTLVAVRAIAPVAGRPPTSGDTMLAIALRKQLDVRVVPRAAHAIGDDGREQRLDRAEHGDRSASATAASGSGRPEPRHAGSRAAGGNAAEAAADRLDRQTCATATTTVPATSATM